MRRVEANRTRLEARNLAFEHLWYGVLLLDADARVRDWNPAAERLLGLEAQDVAGRLPSELGLWAEVTPLEQALFEGLERDGFWAGEVHCRRESGAEAVLGLNAEPIRRPGVEENSIVAVFRDIADRTRMEADLRDAREAAETASRAKGQFLANMSHEIRTPLNGILGITELTLETATDPEVREPFELIQESADTLLRVVNDILDFSRIESGRLELEALAFSVREQVGRCHRLFQARAAGKHLTFTAEVADDVPERLLGDPVRLQQVLNNLIGNALKFTDRGEVRVVVELDSTRRRMRPGWAALRFTVSDTGIGIPPEQHREIFEAFAQADGSTTRRYGGTGLGLAIAGALVEQMGGRIEVRSAPGSGSTFTFSAVLEIAAPEDARLAAPAARSSALDEATPEAAPTRRPLHILLAEDNTINQRVITRMLERAGHSVRIADTGVEALVALREERFDALLLDVQMPEMDGYEVAERIRANEAGAGHRLPIFALTAHALPEDAARCRDAGMDAHFPKPVPRADLLARLDACAPPPAPPAPNAAQRELDYDGLLAQYEEDPELLGEVIALFRRDSPRMVGKIHTALSASHPRDLSRAAHALKGALGNLFAPRAIEAARQVEARAEAENWAQLPASVDTLVREVEHLGPLLDELLAEAEHWE